MNPPIPLAAFMISLVDKTKPLTVRIVSDNAYSGWVGNSPCPRRMSITTCVSDVRKPCRWERLTAHETKQADTRSLTIPPRRRHVSFDWHGLGGHTQHDKQARRKDVNAKLHPSSSILSDNTTDSMNVMCYPMKSCWSHFKLPHPHHHHHHMEEKKTGKEKVKNRTNRVRQNSSEFLAAFVRPFTSSSSSSSSSSPTTSHTECSSDTF